MAVCQYICPGVNPALVKKHPVRILHAEGMAIHAIIVRRLIVKKCFFRKILQTTLVNPHPVPHAVAGRDTAIDQIGIDFIFDNPDGKRRISKPFAIFADINPDRKIPACRCVQQATPFLLRDLERTVIRIHAYFLPILAG